MGNNEFPRMITMNGNLSEEGQSVIEHIENMVKTVRNGKQQAGDLNKLAGHYQQYFRDVVALQQQTSLQFAEEYGRGFMLAAWRDMIFLKESELQKKKVDTTADNQTEIQEQLEQVLKDLEETKKQVTTSKQQITKLNKKLNKKILEDETDTDEDEKDEDDKGADESTDDTNKDDDKTEADD